MSRRVNTTGGRKRRPGGLTWGVGTVVLVAALLYWEQAAVLYVLSSLAVCGLLLIVAFSDLEGRNAELAEAAGQEKSAPAGGGDELTAATVPQPKRRVARRSAGAARQLKTTPGRDGAAG